MENRNKKIIASEQEDNQKDVVDDQNVIDDEMKEYLQMVLDEMKNKNENGKNV